LGADAVGQLLERVVPADRHDLCKVPVADEIGGRGGALNS
jgi:hypothetical protein